MALSAIIIIQSATPAIADENNESLIRQLRYPGNFDFGTREIQEEAVLVTWYKVVMPYPSKSVLEFYERELKKLGWLEYESFIFEGSLKKWDYFENGTIKGSPLVHQLIAQWKNKSEKRMIFFTIKYYSSSKDRKKCCQKTEPDNDIQHIHVQIMPFIDDATLETAKPTSSPSSAPHK